MAERFSGWFCLDMPATLENLFSCRRVEPFATGETRRMAGSCNSFCQALSGILRICDVIGVKPSDIIGTSDEQEMDTAVSFIVRNIDKLTEAQRAELIAALSKL